MIGIRTPFRVSFAGGGTDIPNFYKNYGGMVVSTSINKYMYHFIHKFSQDEIQIKYSGYIDKEIKNVEKINRLENLKIPDGFDFMSMKSLSSEAKEKLVQISPTTLAQASRISGVSPSDISSILVKIGR